MGEHKVINCAALHVPPPAAPSGDPPFEGAVPGAREDAPEMRREVASRASRIRKVFSSWWNRLSP